MENIAGKYRLSIYTEIAELVKEKIYIVKSSSDDRIYIKKYWKLKIMKYIKK